jgi:UrcA family protein
MKNLTSLLIPGALLLGAVFTQPAIAQTAPANAPSVAVTHADLDLNTRAGRERLERRLRIAAREVCGTGFAFDLQSQNAARDCEEETLASIVLPASNTLASAE